MGFGESSLFHKTNLYLLIFAVFIDLIGLPFPFSVHVSGDIHTFHYGLWQLQLCFNYRGYCRSYDYVNDWIAVVRAFGIIGSLILMVAMIFTFVAVFVKNSNIIKLVAWILSFAAAACICIEFAVFVGNINVSSSGVVYSYGFFLTVIAFVLALVAGVIGVIDWRMKISEPGVDNVYQNA